MFTEMICLSGTLQHGVETLPPYRGETHIFVSRDYILVFRAETFFPWDDTLVSTDKKLVPRDGTLVIRDYKRFH